MHVLIGVNVTSSGSLKNSAISKYMSTWPSSPWINLLQTVFETILLPREVCQSQFQAWCASRGADS